MHFRNISAIILRTGAADFDSARCGFSPAVGAALSSSDLAGLWAAYPCAEPSGYRIEQVSGYDAVIVRCDDLQGGAVQWNVAVGQGKIAGLHFDAFGGEFQSIPRDCLPSSLPLGCIGSGH